MFLSYSVKASLKKKRRDDIDAPQNKEYPTKLFFGESILDIASVVYHAPTYSDLGFYLCSIFKIKNNSVRKKEGKTLLFKK